ELASAKALLPRHGGSAQVWTASVLFFQGALIAACLYGQWLRGALGPASRRRLHVGLVVLAGLAPIVWGEPVPGAWPALQVAWALALGVGAPFLALATATVVLQDWLGREDGYELYAASNAGALAALAAFPLVLEPLLPLDAQFRLWRAGYAGFALLLAYCAARGGPGSSPARGPEEAWGCRELSWILLAAAPCAGLLAATHALSLDLAAGPLLWSVPLALYLATLIAAFRRPPWRPAPLPLALAAAGLLWLALFGGLGLLSLAAPAWGQWPLRLLVLAGRLGLGLGALLVLALACHGALASSRPAEAASAPRFYLCVALGGCLGSAAVAVAVPVLGRHTGLLGLDWLPAALLAAAAWGLLRPLPAGVLAGALSAGAAFGVGSFLAGPARGAGTRHAGRSFYGVHSVIERDGVREFFHGNTRHGVQYLDAGRRARPTSYFHERGPFGELFGLLGGSFGAVGVVGLGVGAMAPYARAGQSWDFYELDPDVVGVARQEFTFLADCRAATRVITGDARLQLLARPAACEDPSSLACRGAYRAAAYDVLVLDAFHSDALPMHLATREAVRLYLARLAPRGIVLFHVSNRFLDLRPMFAGMAAELGLSAASKRSERAPGEEEAPGGLDPSTWVALSPDPDRLRPLIDSLGWQDLALGPRRAPWTDQHASLLSALF
ncbi:MAG: hypothetical protein HY554_08735, partial [Elusimicrobia bacterium]|nr:hypothetical protein [Elusimicrobiota bacterium]